MLNLYMSSFISVTSFHEQLWYVSDPPFRYMISLAMWIFVKLF